MENFNFYAPTYFAFGKDRESDCGSLVPLEQKDVEAIYRLMV